jgi:hypothetical protein
MRTAVLAVTFLAAAAAAPAQAQNANTCNNRVVIDTIYQSGTGRNNYEYYVHLRNATRTALTLDVTFSGFPGTVTLFSPQLPGIPIGAHATRSSLKFGRGTNGQISTGTVARVYDAAPGGGPTVRLTNCRPG